MANYQIQSGDTLSQIASRQGRTIAELMATNPQITDPNRIYAGQTLNIPSTETPITPTTGQNTKPTIDLTQFDTGDPIRKFNLALLDMLKKAQSGETQMSQEQTQLKKEAYQSGREVFTGEEAKMTPEAKMATLQRNVEMFEPSIQAATNKIKQLGDITSLITKTYGEDFSAMIPATKEDADVFKKAMAAGWEPTVDILQKYGKYFDVSDWNALVNAKQKAKETTEKISSDEKASLYNQIKTKAIKLFSDGITVEEYNQMKNEISGYGLGSYLDDFEKLASNYLSFGQKQEAGIQTEKQFLTKDYFKTIFTTEQLKQAAKDAGFTKGGFLGFGVGEEGVNDYLDNLMKIIKQYRDTGLSDNEILKLFPKS